MTEALEIAQAFLVHFFDTTKRTEECTDAFVVYSDDSISRITRSKPDNTFDVTNLEGQNSIVEYNLSLPPTQMVVSFFDAVTSHNDTIVIQIAGTETIEGIEYPFYRTFVLVPTPQGGYYCKTDLLHYSPAIQPIIVPVATTESQQTNTTAPVANTEETKKKVLRKKRVAKKVTTQNPENQEVADDNNNTTTTNNIEQEQPQQQQQPEPEVVVAPVPQPQQPKIIETPVTIVQDEVKVEQKQEEPQVPEVVVVEEQKPAPKKVLVPAPVPAQKPTSWAKLFPKPAAPVAPVVEEKKEEKKVEKKPVVEEKKAEAPKKKESKHYPPEQQTTVSSIPLGTTQEELLLALVVYGDVIDLKFDEKKLTAVATFKTIQDAKDVVKASPIQTARGFCTVKSKNDRPQQFRKQ
eukprot:UN00762